VLLVVPRVEVFFGFGRHVHRVEEHAARAFRRFRIARRQLLGLETADAVRFRRHALRPGREVRAADLEIRLALQHRE
jgi:hypothetical protein